MKKSLWLQLFGLSVLITLFTSTISFGVYNRIAATAMLETRKNIYVFLAHLLEEEPYDIAIGRYEKLDKGATVLAGSIWVLAENGKIIASNTDKEPPTEWLTISKPSGIHDISYIVPPFSHFATLVLIRLQATTPTYLLVEPNANSPRKSLAKIEVTLFFFGLLSATFLGIAMIVLYLRKTSLEAKAVIAELRSNKLDTRFPIHRFDRVANLKLDFNAMADEIEQLVHRVQKTEIARKNLLQELSHDLRTPLTSLRTSVETLTAYREQMSAEQQQEFFCVIQSELDYFVRLLDDLFFISDIAEPGYRGALETIDINALLSTEVQARQLAQPQLQWHLHCSTPVLTLTGDAHLLLRLLRNTLDNAAKYANAKIDIGIREVQHRIEIVIADDGPGISAEALLAFGERKKHRVRQSSAPLDLSLGLGSVIIKTIVDLHGGELRIQSSAIDPSVAQGTRFIFLFPQT